MMGWPTWLEWKGGECPVHENTLIDVRYRDGIITRGISTARVLCWDVHYYEQDIVAYRLSEQQSMEEAYEQAHKEIGDSALDVQVGGDHYKKCGIQPITYIHANKIGFMEGNAIKYLSRWRDKGGVDDLKKAKHYIEMLIELEGK